MSTIIDELVTIFSLDDSGYKKGTERVRKSQKETQDVIRKSSEGITKSIMEVTRNVAIMFVGFESATGLINFLAKINQAQASLSRMAQNFGTSARALDVWDKSIELAGGSVQSAQGAIQQLNQDVTALLTQGKVSPLLLFLNKLDIQTVDSANHARDAKAIYADLFNALGRMPRQQAFQLATQAGISADVLSFGLRPDAERAQITGEASRLTRATDDNARQADELRERWVAIKETLQGIGVVFLEKITPVVERLLPLVEKMGNRFASFIQGFDNPQTGDGLIKAVDSLSGRIDGLLSKVTTLRAEITKLLNGDFSDVGTAIENNLKSSFNSPAQAAEQFKQHDPFFGAQPDSAWSKIKDFLIGLSPYQKMLNDATDEYQLPAGLLRGIAQTESSMNPDAVNKKTGARGLMGLNPKVFPDAGQSVYIDIETAAEELKRLHGVYGNWDKALMAYNDGQGNLARNRAQGTVPWETINYPATVMRNIQSARVGSAAAPASQGPVNNNQIDRVTINTQATDGKQVAVDFMAEMRKRDLVLQTDSGIIP